MVEERRKRESLLDSDMNRSQSSDMQESTTSDVPSSPATPTFSLRGHTRFSSSVSSMDPSLSHSPILESPSSPTFAAIKATKRPLPDVQEEPVEREENFEMFDDFRDAYDWSRDDSLSTHREDAMVQSSVQLSASPAFEYDLADGFLSDSEVGGLGAVAKKRRADDSPFTSIANRFGSRFPLFSRKWRTSRVLSPLAPLALSAAESKTPHAPSSRSSSVSNSVHHATAGSYAADGQMPPTPAHSVFADHDEHHGDSDETAREEQDASAARQEGFATTPLLPPLMIGDASDNSDVPFQSPLQSPSVAEHSEPVTGMCTPMGGIATPSMRAVPSPPLSTKPSVASMRRTLPAVPAHLLPSADIPPIVIADVNDKWSQILGHANFTIHPLPYLPATFDVAACRQLREDWDLARCNYTKHLVRTGEHYGVTSTTYQLTEDKWRETDEQWRANNDALVAKTAANAGGADVFHSLQYSRVGKGGEGGEANAMTKIPSLNDPRSEGKFPQLGDEDIVGPMVRGAGVAPQLQRRSSKKAKLMRFFAEKFPAGFGRSSSSSA